MKPYILLLSIFLTVHVLSQPVHKISRLLKEKDFKLLNEYVSYPQKSNVEFGWEVLRNIVDDYQEGMIKIEEYVPSNDGTGGSLINNYRVYLLTAGNKIFYYKLTKTFYKKKGTEKWEPQEKTIDSLFDDNEYVLFESVFKQRYDDTLHHSDLFLTSITYGSHCGIAGINPEYMEQLNSLVRNNKADTIRQWLKSANAEKQLYALMGYRMLVNQGYTLTDEEKRIISIVEKKNGTVSTCSGCMYMNQSIQDVVSEINATPAKYLKPETATLAGNSSRKKEKNLLYWWITGACALIILCVLYVTRKRKKVSVI